MDDKAAILQVVKEMEAAGEPHEAIDAFLKDAAGKAKSRQQYDTLTQAGQGPWAGAEPLPVAPEAPQGPPGETGGNSKYGNPNMVREAMRGMSPEEQRSFRAQGLGTMAGMAVGGGAGMALGGAAAGAGFLGRTALSGLGGAAGGAAEGATRATVEGKPGGEILDEAGRGELIGGALGVGGHLLGEAGAGIAGKLRQGEGWLARFLRAKDSGAYQDPAMQELPGGAKGVQRAGEVGHARVIKQQMAKDAKAGADYDEALHGGPDYTPPAEETPLFAAAAARNRPQRMIEGLPDDRLPSAPFPRERPPSPGAPEAGPQRLIMPPDETPLLGPVTDRGPRFEVTPGGRARRPGATEAELPPGEPRTAEGEGGALMVPGARGVGQARRGPPRAETPEYEPPPGEESVPAAAEGPENYHARGQARDVGYEPPPSAAPGKPPARTAVAAGLDRTVDRNAMLSEMRAGRVANINGDTRLPADKAVDKAFREAIKSLGPKGTVNTAGGVLKLRRAMMAKANFPSANPTPEERAARHVYQTFRAAVRKAAPDIAAADDAFAANARSSHRDNDILTGSEDPAVRPPPEMEAEPSDIASTPKPTEDPQMRVAKEQAGVRRMKREGDVNEPGNMGQRYLDELRVKDKEYAKALDFIGNKKAYEATRFGAPHLATDLKGATGHIAGIPMRWAGQNTRALAAQVGDPAARAAGNLRLAAPFAGRSNNPLFEASDEEQGRLKLRADFLRGGHHK